MITALPSALRDASAPSGEPGRLRADDGRAARGSSLARAGSRSATRRFVVVSIFVNPLQFGPTEDFARYPRREADDAAPAREREGVDVALPAGRRGASTRRTSRPRVEVGGVSEGGEGARRPGHFRGVATVVAKLFLQVAARRRRLRPQGSPAGRRRAADGPRPRLSDPARRRGDRARAGRPRAVVAQRLPLAEERRRAARSLADALRRARRAPRHGERDARRARGRRPAAARSRRASPSTTSRPSMPRRWRRAPRSRPGRGARRRGAAREDAPDRQRFPA